MSEGTRRWFTCWAAFLEIPPENLDFCLDKNYL